MADPVLPLRLGGRRLSRRAVLVATGALGAAGALGAVVAACGDAEPPPVEPTPTAKEFARVFPTPTATRSPTATPSPAPTATPKNTDDWRPWRGSSHYQEAPSLYDRVDAGELPPVDERLPDEPLVAQPWEAIGAYGGRLNFASVSISVDIGNLNRTDTVAYNMEGNALVYDAVKDLWISEDRTTVILELRRGHKWSDGAPFTSENFQWHYDNFMRHEVLSPAGPRHTINGSPPTVNTPDELTVEISVSRARADPPRPPGPIRHGGPLLRRVALHEAVPRGLQSGGQQNGDRRGLR